MSFTALRRTARHARKIPNCCAKNRGVYVCKCNLFLTNLGCTTGSSFFIERKPVAGYLFLSVSFVRHPELSPTDYAHPDFTTLKGLSTSPGCSALPYSSVTYVAKLQLRQSGVVRRVDQYFVRHERNGSVKTYRCYRLEFGRYSDPAPLRWATVLLGNGTTLGVSI